MCIDGDDDKSNIFIMHGYNSSTHKNVDDVFVIKVRTYLSSKSRDFTNIFQDFFSKDKKVTPKVIQYPGPQFLSFLNEEHRLLLQNNHGDLLQKVKL